MEESCRVMGDRGKPVRQATDGSLQLIANDGSVFVR